MTPELHCNERGRGAPSRSRQCEPQPLTDRTGMSRVDAEIIRRIVQLIVDEVNPEQVILFGSRARETERKDSDIDLLVVESEAFGSTRSRRLEAARLYEAVAGFEADTDILVCSREELRTWGGSGSHVLGRALREGRVLHERS